MNSTQERQRALKAQTKGPYLHPLASFAPLAPFAFSSVLAQEPFVFRRCQGNSTSRLVLLALMAVMLMPGGQTSAAETAAGKPNVVFLLADDLGWGDLSCHGSALAQTPNLDRLAKQGTARFGIRSAIGG